MHGQPDYASMHRIHLWGSLREQFLPEYTLRVASVREATRALTHMVKGFGATVAKGHYRIILGDRLTGRLLREQEVGTVLPVGIDVHIVPAVCGSGRSGTGIGKIIVGIILAVATWYAGGEGGWESLGAGVADLAQAGFAVGVGLALSGVAMLLAPQARSSQQQQEQNSFAFGGIQNNTQQGVAAPVVYGTFYTGSVTVSQGISTRQLMN